MEEQRESRKPVILPLNGPETYCFTKKDMEDRFPKNGVEQMTRGQQPLRGR